MKYTFNVKSNQYSKVVCDNLVIEFFQHIYSKGNLVVGKENGKIITDPIIADELAVAVAVVDDGLGVLGAATTNITEFASKKFNCGTDMLIDIIHYDTEVQDVPVVEREYFGAALRLKCEDGIINVTVETGLGKYLDTGCGAISKVDTSKLPPVVTSYNA